MDLKTKNLDLDNITKEENKTNKNNCNDYKNKDNNSEEDAYFYIMTLQADGQRRQIKIYENSNASELAFNFCKTYNLDFATMKYLKKCIKQIILHFNNTKKNEMIYLLKDNSSIQEVAEEEIITDNSLKKSGTIKKNNSNNLNAGGKDSKIETNFSKENIMSLLSDQQSNSNKQKSNNKSNNNNSTIYKSNLNRNRSMNNIKSEIDINFNKISNQTTKNNKSTLDELYNIDVSGKDTLEVLYDLVDQGKLLPERMEKKLEKIDSLIDVKLPFPSSYELVLNYFRKTQNFNDNLNKKYFSYYPILSKNKNKIFNNNIKNVNRTLEELTPSMRKKLLLIKDDIKYIKKSPFFINNLNPMLMTYFGYHTGNHKNTFIINQNEVDKKLTHKHSMDNIMAKRDNTTYVTFKKLINDKNKIDIERKIKSSNDINNKK
jgi:hypothetical protein